MEIYVGDICYIYEYKDRNNIRDFYDLHKVRVDTVSSNGKDFIVSGEEMSGESIVLNSNDVPSRVSGVVVYKKDGDFLIKKSKRYFLSFERNSKGFKAVVKEVTRPLYCIYACFKVDDSASVKLRLNDMCFESSEEIESFLELVNITHAQLYDNKVSYILNKDMIETSSYEVYMGDKYISGGTAKEKLFKYACKSRNPINKGAYDFNKIFSMKLVGYEVSKVNVRT